MRLRLRNGGLRPRITSGASLSRFERAGQRLPPSSGLPRLDFGQPKRFFGVQKQYRSIRLDDERGLLTSMLAD
jgi:hypothetical protein